MNLAKEFTWVKCSTASRVLQVAVAGQTARLHALHVATTGDAISIDSTGAAIVTMGSAIDWDFVPQLDGAHFYGTASKALNISTTAGVISGYAIVSSS